MRRSRAVLAALLPAALFATSCTGATARRETPPARGIDAIDDYVTTTLHRCPTTAFRRVASRNGAFPGVGYVQGHRHDGRRRGDGGGARFARR